MAKQQTPTIETDDDPTYAPRDGWEAPEGSAERVREDDEPVGDISATGGDYAVTGPTEGSVTVTDYDADGEAIDAPVEPPAAELFPPLREPEMHDGRQVQQYQVRFGGKAAVGQILSPDREFWASLRGGRRGYAQVAFVVGDDGYASVRDRDGDVISYTYYRKVKVDGIHIDGSRVGDDDDDDVYEELEEAREEAATLAGRIEDWVLWARDLAADKKIGMGEEIRELLAEMAGYKLPREVEPDPPGVLEEAFADTVTGGSEPSALDEALAEALN